MAEQTRAERLASAYKRLAASAEVLNAASDEFSKPILELETALEKLNVDLITWERVVGGRDDDDNYWGRDVGYTMVDGKWRLVIRAVTGNDRVDMHDVEQWAFNEAPRSYRIEALDKLPDLLEGLTKNADKTAKKLKETTVEVRDLAVALKQATQEVRQKKERR